MTRFAILLAAAALAGCGERTPDPRGVDHDETLLRLSASGEAEAAIARANEERGGKVVTTIEGPATWYPAEDYHQEYWEGEGQRNPYCLAVIPPKLMKLRKSFAEKVKPG